MIKEKLDEGDPKNMQYAVEELQVAIGDLEGMVVKARWDLHHNANEVLTHVGYSVLEIVAAIDRINWCGQSWANPIGNVEALWEDSRHFDLTLVEAMSKAMADQESPHEAISDGLEELSGVVAAVDSNLAKTASY